MAPNNSGLGRILLLAVCVALVIFINRRVHGPGRKNVRRVCAVGEVRLCNCSRSCLPVASWSSRLVLRPCRNYRTDIRRLFPLWIFLGALEAGRTGASKMRYYLASVAIDTRYRQSIL